MNFLFELACFKTQVNLLLFEIWWNFFFKFNLKIFLIQFKPTNDKLKQVKPVNLEPRIIINLRFAVCMDTC